MYVNGKMRLLKLFQEWGRRIKNDGRGEFNYDVFDIL
jgi:hypothetical protein